MLEYDRDLNVKRDYIFTKRVLKILQELSEKFNVPLQEVKEMYIKYTSSIDDFARDFKVLLMRREIKNRMKYQTTRIEYMFAKL